MCWIDPPSKFYRQIFDLDGENSVQVFDSIDDGRQLEYWLLFWEAGDAKNHWDDGTSCEKQSVPVVSEPDWTTTTRDTVQAQDIFSSYRYHLRVVYSGR